MNEIDKAIEYLEHYLEINNFTLEDIILYKKMVERTPSGFFRRKNGWHLINALETIIVRKRGVRRMSKIKELEE